MLTLAGVRRHSMPLVCLLIGACAAKSGRQHVAT